MIDKILGKYSSLVTRHPFIVLVVVVLVSALAVQMAGTIETKSSDTKDMLPQDIEAISTLNTIENEFGSANNVRFVIEIDPAYRGSDEVRDVRDPRVIKYLDTLSELARHTDDVIEVTGPSQVSRKPLSGQFRV